MRFQVSLPTPLAVIAQYIEASAQSAVEAPYRDRLLAEAREITGAIPHADLAVQWDVAVEFAVLEGIRRVHFQPVWLHYKVLYRPGLLRAFEKLRCLDY